MSETSPSDQTSKPVVAVLVTYNRARHLEGCLDALLCQTRTVFRVILVDNASTDDTPAMLARRGFLANPRISYHRMLENTGGSGGFHFGLSEAMKIPEAGWFWLMDDDVAPRAACLETLLRYSRISECLHPLVAYADGSHHEWEHLIDPGTTYQIGLNNGSFKNGKDWCAMHTACFEGMLVSRKVAEIVDLPRREFFVYADDNLYGWQASMHTNVIYVRDAVFDKAIKPGRDHKPFKIYYDIRNRFALRRLMRDGFRCNVYNTISFYVFMVFHTANFVRGPLRAAKVLAALRAWHDGARGLEGRRRY